MGIEIREQPVPEDEFAEMREFVYEYLRASVERKDDGARMRWYPWHSADYRYTHVENVVELAGTIAEAEGADVTVTRVAALFHDVAKLDADQEVHAEEGARVTREYLETHGDYPESFIDAVCRSVRRHSHQGELSELSLETRSLVEADILDKIGVNGVVLMLLRMGYESRVHTDAGEMVDRVIERGEEATDRIESDTAESIAHQRLKRTRWLREWFADEVATVGPRDS